MTKLDQGGPVPPSDPWHEAAPLDGAAWPSQAVPDDVVVPDNGPRHRRPWRGIALIAAVVLAAAIGFGLRSPRSHDPAATPTLAAPAPTASAGSAPATVTVVYAVTAGTGDIGSVQYTDRDGDIVSRGGIDLPWRVTFQVTGEPHAFVLIAQRKQGGTGAVTCSITVGGKVLSSARQTGRYAAPECSA